MQLKPSILKGMETILGAKKVENFVNDAEDFLIIEDNSGRIRISNSSYLTMRDFSPSHYVTGIIAAVKGRLDDKGVFTMEDIIYNRVNNYFLPKRVQSSYEKEDKVSLYNILQNTNNNIIAFVSGLQFGNTDYSGKSQLARNLLIDFFQGRFSNDELILKMIKRINRLIIVGDSINSPDDTDLVEKGSFMKQDLNSRVMRTLLKNFDEFDEFLNILSHSVRVDVMPGSEDNSSCFFPQLPLNKIMFSVSSSHDSVNFVPNPYSFKYDDLLFTGTSGQNIKNIQQYTKISESTLDIMEKTLEWNHLSPSSPDTIRTYPVSEKDPLIIENVPNVYFTGNAKNFETRLTYYNQTALRLISIPQFCKSHSIVLLDLSTLEVCEYSLEFFNS
jgi:DNA polymerase delta subunit 2